LKKERFRVEFVDDDGAKVTLTLDGKQSDRSLAKFVMLVEKLRKSRELGELAKNPELGDKYDMAWEPLRPVPENTSQTSGTISQGREPELREPTAVRLEERSKINDVFVLVRSLPDDWFTSLDLKGFYEQRFGTAISLSMISTYLSRLVDKGYLYRVKGGRSFKYRIKKDVLKTQMR